MKELSIVYLKTGDLIPYENNPRNNDGAVEYVANSIREFGFKVPIIIDRNNVIVAGHTRLKAALQLGMEEVPCVRADDLTEEQVKALRLADNKFAEYATWDLDALALELDDINIDMSGFGFEEFCIDELEGHEVIEDDIPEKAETRCKLGDIWLLGDHRLICGDSTKPGTFEKLLEGDKADISFTSPPYNAGHLDIIDEKGLQDGTTRKYLNDDDKKSDDDYIAFLISNIDLLMIYSDEIFYNIGVSSGTKSAISDILHSYKDNFKDLIYWEKNNAVPQINENCISSSTELIIALGKNGSRAFNYFNDRLFHGVINGTSAAVTNQYADIHKATFPVYLPVEIIERFTKKHGSVIDCFGGTGTTMIACEQLGRKCYMVEVEPEYCDIIIKRWEDFTGKEAVRIRE